MSTSSFTIWCNAVLNPVELERLRLQAAPHRLHVPESAPARTALDAAPEDRSLFDADVVFGQPSVSQLLVHPKLRWFEVSSAGYGRYDREDLKERFLARRSLFSNASSVFADPCAQHVLAMMLALGRRLHASYDDQRGDRGWNYTHRRYESVLLTGQSVVLLGYGAIGRRLAELLAPFQVRLTAVRRRAYSERGVRVVGQESLTAVLAEADHVVNLLPENESTTQFVNARRLACFKSGSRFYNVGRGSTVDQRALVESLLSGRLGAAFLDVTQVEPLPPDDPLWSLPNCYITPHTAGGRADQDAALVDHFLKNLRSFETGGVLTVDQVW